MSKLALMQPTFLPWLGFFHLIATADTFVYYDTAQFQKRTWHNRNRIRLSNGSTSFVTMKTRCNFPCPIKEVLAVDKRNVRKLVSTITQSYAKATYRHQISDIVAMLSKFDEGPLGDLNISLIQTICTQLSLTPPTARTSNLSLKETDRSGIIASVCDAMGARSYITPRGAVGYLTEDRFPERYPSLDVYVQDFQHPRYPQAGPGQFQSHLSVIDVLANCPIEDVRSFIEQPGLVEFSEWRARSENINAMEQ